MFDKNILTVNPGWGSQTSELSAYQDIRKLQQHFLDRGSSITSSEDEQSNGSASFTIEDADGNPILFDQHC